MKKCGHVSDPQTKEVIELRKVMLLAAMLAMVLAAVVPAYAQTASPTPTGGPSVVVSADDEQYTIDVANQAVCQNILGAAAALQYTNQQGLAGEDLAQGIAAEQNVSVEQVNFCLNQLGATAPPTAKKTVPPKTVAPKKTVPPKTVAPKKTAAPAATPAATPTASPTASPTATATATASPTALPPTGGLGTSSALALGAGALLVAGSLVARRLLR
jgi:hypothetical protein